jgi:S-adenosylhomocysteine hydrolase
VSAAEKTPAPAIAHAPGSAFLRLPVLDSLIEMASGGVKPLKGIGVVCVQHLLETTGSLLEALVRLGVQAEHIFVLGKLYSNCPEVQTRLRSIGVRVMESRAPKRWGGYHQHLHDEAVQMWHQFIPIANAGSLRRVIVLDDGGHGVTAMPVSFARHTEVIGIEQTMSGTFWEQFNKRTMPVIDVASSAAKTFIEPPLISEAIMKKLTSRIAPAISERICGVAGLGNVGAAVAHGLLAAGHSVYAFDRSSRQRNKVGLQGVTLCVTLQELFERCNVIFGCTGRDILSGEDWWRTLEGRRVLISCSSNDTEFSSALATMNDSVSPNSANALNDLTIPLRGGELTLLRAGYPCNFDGTPESVPRNHIQMTRGLLLGGVLQAAAYEFGKAGKSRSKMLSPEMQQFVVETWLTLQPECRRFYEDDVRLMFKDLSIIAARSGGQLDRPKRSGG